LRTVANDGDLLALDQGEVGVLVVIDFHDFPFVICSEKKRVCEEQGAPVRRCFTPCSSPHFRV
jgi:hypothetical protein